jgi:hypothetical protein
LLRFLILVLIVIVIVSALRGSKGPGRRNRS